MLWRKLRSGRFLGGLSRHVHSFATEPIRSRQASSWAELGGGRELRSPDLAAVGGLDPEDADAAVRARDREALAVDGDDLSHLAGDARRLFGRHRFGVENLQLFSIVQRPGAGLRIAAANQIVNLSPGLAPVDAGIVRRAPAFVGRLAFVLFD